MARRGADITREKLLSAAHDLFVERATHTATVSEICDRADVNVAMVKYCFGSKDGLLDALLERVLRGLSSEIDRLSALHLDPEEALHRHVAEIVRNYVRYPYVNRLMNERLQRAEPGAVDRISASFAIPARDFYATLLAEGRRRSGWREIDPTLFFFSVVGICEFLFAAGPLLERSFQATMDPDLVERYIEHATALVSAGVAQRVPGPTR
ncbi:TetR family transcriptional regulator [Baekduia soli]|uniref:TetR family transcriptional regulator n=1 Tax=Baekduia soli TaxID=496014 RepID=UPI00165282CE|nr:TetR family transcriptional regulator [Baekduia soli]